MCQTDRARRALCPASATRRHSANRTWRYVMPRRYTVVYGTGEGTVCRPSWGADSALDGTMTWRDYIHSDPKIAVGKPVVRGTRLAVDFLLELFANGWTQEQVLEEYPQLTAEALRAVFAFAAEVLHEDKVYATRRANG